MPEIKTEVPADSELRQYLLECFPFISDEFTFIPPGPWEGYADADRFSDFRLLESIGFNSFFQRAVTAVFQCLQRLNQLPRDDPFWHNTNRRPTVPKLWGFCRRLLQRDSGDTLALWTWAALELLHGSNDFGQAEWKALARAGVLEITWPIYAALYTELNAAPSAEALATLLVEFNGAAEAIPFIETLTHSEGANISAWARRVLAHLGET